MKASWIPNLLTLGRVVLVIPTLVWLQRESYWISCFSLVLLFLTDYWDGWLARKYSWESRLGSILDPIADKLVAIIFFSYFFWLSQIPIIYFFLVLFRDLSQILGVIILIFIKKISFQAKPKQLPKWATAIKYIILGGLLAKLLFPEFSSSIWFFYLATFLLICSSLLEIHILFHFFPRFLQIYRKEHDTFE